MFTMTARARAGFGAALMLVAGAACSKGSPTQTTQPPSMTIVSPTAAVSDTAMALVAQPLVVEVRDSTGKPRQGVLVRFVAGTTNVNGGTQPTAYVSATTPDQYSAGAELATDATGRAAVRVRLGQLATTATVQIEAPTMGVAATASFTVLPGATVRTSVLPRDTAVYVGGSYALRVVSEDRWGNTTSSVPAAASSDAPSVATATAASVTAVAIGRTRIAVTVGGQQQQAFVSVVPQGTLLAVRQDGIYTFALDGSGYRRVVQVPGARSPRWLPSGQRFVFSHGLGHGGMADLNGAVQPLVAGANPLVAELWPHPSRDGQWIYFGGYAGSEFRGYPHRVRVDGTGLQLVPGFVRDDHTQGHPSTSPAGDRVAYFREAMGDSRNVTLRILNMQTGQVVVSGVQGHSPEWSHGDSIAYLYSQGGTRGPIRLMSSTGQGHRQVGTGMTYNFGVDWSPDDQWIVAHDLESQLLEIIGVASGVRIPLPYSAGLSEPAWKP